MLIVFVFIKVKLPDWVLVEETHVPGSPDENNQNYNLNH
jgi:hypothetical protein